MAFIFIAARLNVAKNFVLHFTNAHQKNADTTVFEELERHLNAQIVRRIMGDVSDKPFPAKCIHVLDEADHQLIDNEVDFPKNSRVFGLSATTKREGSDLEA